jgi:hypothetical protein
MIINLQDSAQELNKLREVGFQKGASVGFDWERLPYTISLGSTTYIAAAPATGKTEFLKEILINLSCLHGWRHVIWSPETGSAAEIYAELCHAYIGKPYIKSHWQMSESERMQAEAFVNDYFFVLDNGENDLTLENFYKEVDKLERETGYKIHTTTIDPWNELEEIYTPSDLGREDKYISRMLSKVRKNARSNQRHNFILTHVRDQVMITEGGLSYFPFPHAREISGGQTWFRKGMTVILLWRPPHPLSDKNSRQYGECELHVRIAKTKPKGTSKTGTYIMNLDVRSYQYYFIDDYGKKIYANRGKHEYNKEIIEPIKPLPINYDFDSNGDIPF